MQTLLLSLTKPFGTDYAKGVEITDDKSNDMNRIKKNDNGSVDDVLVPGGKGTGTDYSAESVGLGNISFPSF